MKIVLGAACLCLLVCGCNGDSTSSASVDRDNTAVNERDANSALATPMDQSNDQADIDQVAKIRAEVLELDDLSVNGQNVKIITDNGKVVLRGPVASTTERNAVGKVAERIAGAEKVDNQLEVEKD